MISVVSVSEDEGDSTFEPMSTRWKFPSLTEACTSDACQAVIMGDAACMASDNDLRSFGSDDDDDDDLLEQKRKKFRLIATAAQSIDAAVESVVDRFLPVKNKSMTKSRSDSQPTPHPEPIHRSLTAGKNESNTPGAGSSIFFPFPTCAGVLDDDSLVESIMPRKTVPHPMPRNMENRNKSGYKVKEFKDNYFRPGGPKEVSHTPSTMYISPAAKSQSETSISSESSPDVKQRRWLGWFRRKKRDGASSIPVTRVWPSRAGPKRPQGFDEDREHLSRYIHDDEYTLTKEQGSIHTIRIHRVPTDFLIITKK